MVTEMGPVSVYTRPVSIAAVPVGRAAPSGGAAPRPHRRSPVALVALALVVSGFGLTGCSIVAKVKKVEHDVEGNKATIDAFTTKVQSGESVAFEATYKTTGSAPATIVYAVQPPKGLAFTDTPSGVDRNHGATSW